jgi:hypothetical protein
MDDETCPVHMLRNPLKRDLNMPECQCRRRESGLIRRYTVKKARQKDLDAEGDGLGRSAFPVAAAGRIRLGPEQNATRPASGKSNTSWQGARGAVGASLQFRLHGFLCGRWYFRVHHHLLSLARGRVDTIVLPYCYSTLVSSPGPRYHTV